MSDLKPITMYCCKGCQHLHHEIVTSCDCGTGCDPFEYELWEARRTQPEAAPAVDSQKSTEMAINGNSCSPVGNNAAQDLSAAIEWLRNNYQDHANIADLCDAMRAALASSANALSGAIDKDAKIVAQRARIMELEEQLARALGTPVNDWCPECHARESSGDALSAGDSEKAMQFLLDNEVDTIYLDDGRIIDVGGKYQGRLIEAILQSQKEGHG